MNREPIKIEVYDDDLFLKEHKDYVAVDVIFDGKALNLTHSKPSNKLQNMQKLIEALLVIYKQWEEDR